MSNLLRFLNVHPCDDYCTNIVGCAGCDQDVCPTHEDTVVCEAGTWHADDCHHDHCTPCRMDTTLAAFPEWRS